MAVRNIQASLPPPRTSLKAATSHCIIVSFCHMMAVNCHEGDLAPQTSHQLSLLTFQAPQRASPARLLTSNSGSCLNNSVDEVVYWFTGLSPNTKAPTLDLAIGFEAPFYWTRSLGLPSGSFWDTTVFCVEGNCVSLVLCVHCFSTPVHCSRSLLSWLVAGVMMYSASDKFQIGQSSISIPSP